MLIGNPGCLVYDAIVGRAGAIGPMVVCFTGNRVFGRLSDVRLGETANGRLFLGDPGKSKSPECRAQAILVFRARGRCPRWTCFFRGAWEVRMMLVLLSTDDESLLIWILGET
ncbi:hypothetical protein HBH92_174460 [Parastagonospora nodorum]|nr:hypothetical protein HBH92_174460 [Parastagonospora nodorum]KAH4447809.1 hypothetical protein HBH93_050520 [Parastagonospora nodorum]KAH4460553.1 hypothetical protein HBH91_069640 [Parastagonospora nodorum]KAH4497028.1 hypothetical protein HBH89_137810 [Parastagonospora nodorum]KAH4535407.1 hypothetical protein HBH85_161160 [Parastagonospora nodorum]